MKKLLMVMLFIGLFGCQTETPKNTFTSGTWVGYGFGVTENTGRLSR